MIPQDHQFAHDGAEGDLRFFAGGAEPEIPIPQGVPSTLREAM